MKLPFVPPTKNKGVQTYCINPDCLSTKLKHNPKSARDKVYTCPDCGQWSSRALIIDPQIRWWIDQTTREYWHETAGVFVGNDKGEFLFFDRVKHPFGLTVPAGHVDRDEAVEHAAYRELFEETGLKGNQLVPVRALEKSLNIQGDECRRGSDAHKWHVYATRIKQQGQSVKIDASEGLKPVWLSLKDALRSNPTPAVRLIIECYSRELEAATS